MALIVTVDEVIESTSDYLGDDYRAVMVLLLGEVTDGKFSSSKWKYFHLGGKKRR